MKVSQMLPSTYLKKDDVTDPLIVTIDHLEEANVAPQGQPEEKKWVLFFAEFEKGMVLNSTNIHLIVQATNCGDTDDWPGKEVVIYNDPSVSYAGKVTGGLRIRAKERAPIRPARPVVGGRAEFHGKPTAESWAHADQAIPLDNDVPF